MEKTSDSQATQAAGLVKDGFAPVIYTSILVINRYCMEVMGRTYASVFCIQRVLNNLWPYWISRDTLAPGSLVALNSIVISGLNERTQSSDIFSPLSYFPSFCDPGSLNPSPSQRLWDVCIHTRVPVNKCLPSLLSSAWSGQTQGTASESLYLTSACLWLVWPSGCCVAVWCRRGHPRTWPSTTPTSKQRNRWVAFFSFFLHPVFVKTSIDNVFTYFT